MGLSAKEIEDAIKKNKGLLAPAARQLGISRTQIYRRINKNKRLQRVRHEAKEELKDYAESQLLKLIKQEDKTSVIFFLKTQCKDRGYIEQVETKDVSETKKQIFKIGNQIIEFE